MDETVVAEAEGLLESITGFRSPSSNRPKMGRTLERLAGEAGKPVESLVAAMGKDPSQLQRLINEILIGETYFFREAAQFRLLRDIVLPRLASESPTLVAWSASCSTGEEAISLAAIIAEFQEGRPGMGHVVHASDINDASLARLREGIYPRSALRHDGSEFHGAFLKHHVERADESTLTISVATLNAIKPHHLNLLSDRLDPIPDMVDLAFFRNTLLYSPEAVRDAMIDRITRKLRPGGALFLGMSELPFVHHPLLRLEESHKARYFTRRQETGKTRPEARKPDPTASRTADRRAGLADNRGAKDIRRGIPRIEDEALRNPDNPENPENPSRRVPTLHSVMRLLNDPALVAGLIEGKGEELGEGADPSLLVAGFVARSLAAVARGDSEGAALNLAELSHQGHPGIEGLVRFCRGWREYMRGRSDLAEAEMALAVDADEAFWPARFYLATIRSRRGDPGAIRDFKRCVASIDAFSEEDNHMYDFLLDGFDTGYFRRMCLRSIEKRDAGGEG